MTLYEADLDKIAVEVKSVQKRKLKASKEPKPAESPKEKVRKPRAKKVKVDKENAPENVETIETKTETVEEVKPEVKPEVKAEIQVKPEEPAETPKKEKKPRAPRQKKDPAVPPQWFAKYVEGVKKEQATHKSERVPVKRLKQEASEEAVKSWNNGLTRNRVQNEVDSHSKLLLT
jgi:hypothetical protein